MRRATGPGAQRQSSRATTGHTPMRLLARNTSPAPRNSSKATSRTSQARPSAPARSRIRSRCAPLTPQRVIAGVTSRVPDREEDVAHRALDQPPAVVRQQPLADAGIVPFRTRQDVLEAIERLHAGQPRLLGQDAGCNAAPARRRGRRRGPRTGDRRPRCAWTGRLRRSHSRARQAPRVTMILTVASPGATRTTSAARRSCAGQARPIVAQSRASSR